MKRLIPITFILLTFCFSGVFQFAFHLCSESGFHWSDAACNVKHHRLEEKKKSCCKKAADEVNEHKAKDSKCCEDAYFVAFAPQYGKIQQQEVTYRFGWVALLYIVTAPYRLPVEETITVNYANPPPEKEHVNGRVVLLASRKLII